jgi:nicotinamide-nucleotide amidase
VRLSERAAPIAPPDNAKSEDRTPGKPGARRVAMSDVERLAERLLKLLETNRLKLVVAESCTAGLLSQKLADAPGASAHFNGGFVTYTKEQKTTALDVSPTLLREQSAVCGAVARAMAEGALRRSSADLAAAITGVAGPEPDPDGNPVGRVCIAVERRGGATEQRERHYGNRARDEIRACAIAETIEMLMTAAGAGNQPPRGDR